MKNHITLRELTERLELVLKKYRDSLSVTDIDLINQILSQIREFDSEYKKCASDNKSSTLAIVKNVLQLLAEGTDIISLIDRL